MDNKEEAVAIDYDLNVYRLEDVVKELEGNVKIYDYVDPWYIQVYIVDGNTHAELGDPIELTAEESKKLDLGNGYFEENDNWYGLLGFIPEYGNLLSERLKQLLSLPKYQEETLF